MLRVMICLLLLTSSAYSQDWFSIAEEVFDVDYYEIERVRVLGDDQRGIVLCVWMSDAYNKVVLTKTLHKSNRNITNNSGVNNSSYNSYYGEYESNENNEEIKTVDDLLYEINEIIRKNDVIINSWGRSIEEDKLEEIYMKLAKLRTHYNYMDIFETIKYGIEFVALAGSKMLMLELRSLHKICNDETVCIENYNEFVSELKNKYKDIEVKY